MRLTDGSSRMAAMLTSSSSVPTSYVVPSDNFTGSVSRRPKARVSR